MTEELETLRRIEALLRSLVRSQLFDRAQIQLNDPKRRRLHELTGTGTVRELAKKTGYSIGQISTIWQEWESLGLIVKDGQKYRRVL